MEWMEERSHVLDQQFGFLHRSEMPALWHFRPSLRAVLYPTAAHYDKMDNPQHSQSVLLE